MPAVHCLLKVVHVLIDSKLHLLPGQRVRPAYLSLPSPAVLARQLLEHHLPDAVPE